MPNRYTFTCPYCNCQNLDQEGLVEHCTTHHARDTRQVVRKPHSTAAVKVANVHELNLGVVHLFIDSLLLCFGPGVPHLCFDALGRPWIQECWLFPAPENQTHLLLWYFCCKLRLQALKKIYIYSLYTAAFYLLLHPCLAGLLRRWAHNDPGGSTALPIGQLKCEEQSIPGRIR